MTSGLIKRWAMDRRAWIAAGLVTVVMAFVSIFIWFGAEYIVRIFNTEPEMVALTSDFMRIQIAGYMVFGMVIILMQCINGVGDTVMPMLTTLITMWVVQVPLAYSLSRFTNLGVYGVRWGMVTANIVRAVIYLVYFRLGRWKRKIV